MWKLWQLWTAVALSAALTVSPANADTPKSPEVKTEIKGVKAKTMMTIEKEIDSIQAKIRELETKGLENLTDKEFDKLDELKDRLIALKKQETVNNDRLIALEDEKRRAYEEVNSKLSSIKGSLLWK